MARVPPAITTLRETVCLFSKYTPRFHPTISSKPRKDARRDWLIKVLESFHKHSFFARRRHYFIDGGSFTKLELLQPNTNYDLLNLDCYSIDKFDPSKANKFDSKAIKEGLWYGLQAMWL